MKILIKYAWALSVVLLFGACKKDFLKTKPEGYFLESGVRELGEASPTALVKVVDPSMKGIYTYMYSYNTANRSAAASRHDDFGQKAIDLSTDVMTEDIVQAAHHWFGFSYLVDEKQAAFARTFTNWNYYYTIISLANDILDKIDPTTTNAELKGVRGQALGIRAHSYLNLIQLYQHTYKGNETAKGVPIYTTAARTGNPRASVQEVYTQIETDLLAAITSLAGFNRTSKEQINQRVAQGLLARAYLNMERWADAATLARAARTGFTLMSATEYNAGFNDINNQEWMWGGDLNASTSTTFASFFSHMDNTSPGYNGALAIYKLIDKKLYDQISATDARKAAFKAPGSTVYPALPAYANIKFRDPGGWVGDYVYMRAAEMFLIEAEALARQGSNAQAAQVLFDLVKTRDASYTLSTLTGGALVDEVILHRRIELWGEGFSLNDYKRWRRGVDRTGSNHRSDAILQIPAGSNLFILQLPQREIDTNTNIPASDQNP